MGLLSRNEGLPYGSFPTLPAQVVNRPQLKSCTLPGTCKPDSTPAHGRGCIFHARPCNRAIWWADGWKMCQVYGWRREWN